MGRFNSGPGGITLEDGFLTEAELLERYVGNQLWVWGLNTNGQLGDSTITHRSSPVQTIAGGNNWKMVSVGSSHTAAIKTDGTLWIWGRNLSSGQLGDGTRTSRSSPVQTIAGGNNWKMVSAESSYTAAIKTDGTLWLWGNNGNGQLGDNTVTSRSSPVQTIAGGNNWKMVSISGFSYTAAIKTDGTLWLWGYNSYGSLGDSTRTHRSSPVQTVSGGTNWKLIGSGWYHTVAIKTDGTLWLWGQNRNGQLGDNTVTHRSSPVQTVAGGTDWKFVDGGDYHTAALKTDGTFWTWGRNADGQLGDNTVTHRSSPVQTITGGTNWKQCNCSGLRSGGIKTDGTLWLWGQNLPGTLGDETNISRSSPVQTVAGGTNWKYLSLGGSGSQTSGSAAALTFSES